MYVVQDIMWMGAVFIVSWACDSVDSFKFNMSGDFPIQQSIKDGLNCIPEVRSSGPFNYTMYADIVAST